MARQVVELDTNGKRTAAFDDFDVDWLVFDRAQRVLKKHPWDWDPFDWQLHVWSPLFESAALVDTSLSKRLLGLISISAARYPNHLSVEYLQTSPRNHGRYRQHSGWGRELMSWAEQRSHAKGFGGALKLISKPPTSEGFYIKLGLAHVGDIHGHKIFEKAAQNVVNPGTSATLKGTGSP